MSWYSKVVWSEGLFLRPQHFQQQDRHAEWYVEARSRAAGGLFWGFTHLEIDEAALGTGKVALAAARGVLPDGTPFDFPATHPAPVPLDIPADTRNAVIYLALPLRRAQSPEASPDGDPAAHLARYTPVEESLVDAAGSDGASEPIEVAHPRLVLALADQLSDAFVRVGVLRVVERRPDNNLLVDKAYIPPVLACRASPVLGGFLREIRGLLGQRGNALAARLAQPGAGGVAEIADFIFLLTVNRHQPVFDHLAELTQLHPERLFSQLLALSGELATLVGSERRPAPRPSTSTRAGGGAGGGGAKGSWAASAGVAAGAGRAEARKTAKGSSPAAGGGAGAPAGAAGTACRPANGSVNSGEPADAPPKRPSGSAPRPARHLSRIRKYRRRVVELGLEHIAADGQPLAPGEHHPVALAHRPAVDRRRVAARVDEDEVRPVELDARLHAGDMPLRVGQRQLVVLLPTDRPAPAVEVETQRPGQRSAVEADDGDSHGRIGRRAGET